MKVLTWRRNGGIETHQARMMNTIERSDDALPVCEHIVEGSDKLFLFFGGIAGAIGMPPFEFFQSARILDCSKIFLRDQSQSWYQRGLPNLGNDAFAIGDYLRLKIEQSAASEVCFVGNSMGGFAALLFCAMLKHGRAICFSPQTFVCQEKRLKYGDDRWPNQITDLHRSKTSSDIHDLRSWIMEHYPRMSASVYVSTSDRLDSLHAAELEGFENIRVHHYPFAGHTLVTWLRDQGELARIFGT